MTAFVQDGALIVRKSRNQLVVDRAMEQELERTLEMFDEFANQLKIDGKQTRHGKPTEAEGHGRGEYWNHLAVGGSGGLISSQVRAVALQVPRAEARDEPDQEPADLLEPAHQLQRGPPR